jgi:aquaporin Z
MHSLKRRLAAEFFGTFWLVLGGCGAAVLGGNYLGVALAFGLTVLTMVYAVGHISGGHFNPAVTLGLATGKRFDWKDVPAYVVTQVVAAIVAAFVLFLIAHGVPGFSAIDSGFATNGYGDRSPGGYNLLSVMLIEVVMTAFFLYIILGATDTIGPALFAGWDAIAQLWVFILVPTIGGLIAGATYLALFGGADAVPLEEATEA